jgi:hypothetical protein
MTVVSFLITISYFLNNLLVGSDEHFLKLYIEETYQIALL